jgi:citrate lyase subunit alpha/citrate CoA-transferase
VIVDEVTTVTGPGELIDVIVTERGIAINPRRQDLMDAVKGKGLPIRAIEDIKAEVERICGGKPKKPRLGDRPVAVVKWVDGTVLDTVWRVLEDNPYATKIAGGE